MLLLLLDFSYLSKLYEHHLPRQMFLHDFPPRKKKKTTKKRVLTVFGEWLVCSQSFVCLRTAALLFSVLSTYVFACTMDYTANLKHQFHSCVTAEQGGCARIAHLSGEVRIMFEEVVDKVFPF